MNPDPLAALRDIHLPADPSWWPPAPGWWLLCLLALAVLSAAFVTWYRARRRGAPARAARRELAAIEARYRSTGDGAAAARELSALLKRLCLAQGRDDQVAGLTGEHWLAFLDRVSGTREFTAGAGRALAEGGFAPRPLEAGPLFRLAETAIAAFPRPSLGAQGR